MFKTVVKCRSPKAWRPAMSAAAHTAQLVEWPTWDDEALAHIEGQPPGSRPTFWPSTCSGRSRAKPGRRASANAAHCCATPAGAASRRVSTTRAGIQPVERAGRLRQLLSADDHDSARASVNNSHYTDPLVIHWIWAGPAPPGLPGRQHPRTERRRRGTSWAACRPTLPSAAASRRSSWTASLAHPSQPLRGMRRRCFIGGFEAATLAEGTYDLILSNVPFGRYGVLDNRNRPLQPSQHPQLVRRPGARCAPPWRPGVLHHLDPLPGRERCRHARTRGIRGRPGHRVPTALGHVRAHRIDQRAG